MRWKPCIVKEMQIKMKEEKLYLLTAQAITTTPTRVLYVHIYNTRQASKRPGYCWPSPAGGTAEADAEACSELPTVGDCACADEEVPPWPFSPPAFSSSSFFSLNSWYFSLRRDSLAIWTKFMPQMMDQTQPTMTTKLTIWSRADIKFRPNDLAGFPSFVWQPHRHVQDEMKVPEDEKGLEIKFSFINCFVINSSAIKRASAFTCSPISIWLYLFFICYKVSIK